MARTSTLESLEGAFGRWGQGANCYPLSISFAIGFQLYSQHEQKTEGPGSSPGEGVMDNIGAMEFRLFCDDGYGLLKDGDVPRLPYYKGQGSYAHVHLCGAGFYICGFRTQVDIGPSGKGYGKLKKNI